ncbi:MAG: hypothetical protein GXO20_01300, partial [Thermodesulfobacteria bacterium]|nr:hypothetical protein [Thermodesulfobacteriota bacterium]
LKAALEVSKAYLATRGFRSPVLWTMARFCSASLTEVPLRRIRAGDFVGLRLSSFMKPYQKPLELARIILTRIACEPDPSRWESEEVEVFPYAINMHQLFERYCEVLLRRKKIQNLEPNGLWAGDENLGSNFKVRPDFLIVKDEEGIVADAKYKPDWPSKYKDEYRGDVYQMVAYTQHKEVRKKLKELKARQDKIKQICIFYPAENRETEKEEINDFESVIIAYPIFVGKQP